MERSAPSGSKIQSSLTKTDEHETSESSETGGGSQKETDNKNSEDDTEKEKSQKTSCLDLSQYSSKESSNELDPDSKPNEVAVASGGIQIKSNDLILPAENLERKAGEASFQDAEREIQLASKMTDMAEAIKLALLTLTPEQINSSNSETIHNILQTKIQCRSVAHKLMSKYDNHQHMCTDLIRLQNLPKFLNLKCQLWVKCEFQNMMSGSSKDRVVAMLLEDLESSERIVPFKTTLITHTSSVFTMALAIANIRRGKKYEIMSILSDRASKFKCKLLNHMNLKIIRAPEEASDNRVSKDSPAMMALFLSTKIKDSYILDPFQEAFSMETHFWWTGPELLAQFDDKIDMLVCGYETGGMISGLSPFVKHANENCIVIGADISGQLANPNHKSTYDRDTVFIEDYAFPSLSRVLNTSAADKWYKVPVKETFIKARELMLKEGMPVSASSGGVLFAALEAIRDYGLGDKPDAKIVLILDNSVLYTDFEFSSNDWLVNNNFLTHEDIEMTVWFHKIRIWRIPVKIPVTVHEDFNAFAVYSMMTTNRIGRVIVQNAETNAILGVSAYELIRQHIWNGTINSNTLIGQSSALCTSFKTISIQCNVGSLLEVLKTHTFAVLVQKQNVCSTLGQREEELLAGILNFEDIIRFITDLEQKHSEKFGANLSGGFCRPMPRHFLEKMKRNENIKQPSDSLNSNSNSDQNPSDKCLFDQDLSSLVQSIAPCFAETIVMNSTTPPHSLGSHVPRDIADSQQPPQPLSVYAPTSSDTFVSTSQGDSADPRELAQHFDMLQSAEEEHASSVGGISRAPSESFVTATTLQSLPISNLISQADSQFLSTDINPNQQISSISTTHPNNSENSAEEVPSKRKSDLQFKSLPEPEPEPVQEFTTIFTMETDISNSSGPNSSSNSAQVSPAETGHFNSHPSIENKFSLSEQSESGQTAQGQGSNFRSESEPFDPSSLFSTAISQPFTLFLPCDLSGNDILNPSRTVSETHSKTHTHISSTDLISMDSKIILTTAGSSTDNIILIDSESDRASMVESGVEMEVPFEYSSIRVSDLIMQAMYSGQIETSASSQNYEVLSDSHISTVQLAAISNSSSYNFIESTGGANANSESIAPGAEPGIGTIAEDVGTTYKSPDVSIPSTGAGTGSSPRPQQPGFPVEQIKESNKEKERQTEAEPHGSNYKNVKETSPNKEISLKNNTGTSIPQKPKEQPKPKESL